MVTCKLRRKLYAEELQESRTFLSRLLDDPATFDSKARPRLADALSGTQLPALIDALEEILQGFVVLGVARDLARLAPSNLLYAAGKDRAFDSVDSLLPVDGSVAAAAPTFKRAKEVTDWMAYQSYFNMFITPDEVTQNGTKKPGVDAFFERYPLLRHAVTTSANHYQQNIKQACSRIANDWGDIEKAFFASPKLKKLLAIETTGNDFHKGGKQVLILEFLLGDDTRGKVVYKPSAVEIDCRIVGDTAAVNRVAPQGYRQDSSLTEIVNRLLAPRLTAFNYPKLPTYSILPYNRDSVADSYGYLEFLTHNPAVSYETKYGERIAGEVARELAMSGPGVFGDWVTNDAHVSSGFHYVSGAVLAMAMSVSLCDLHVQNVIVHKSLPHLIDLEESLKHPMSTLDDTYLPMALGRTEEPGGMKVVVDQDKTPQLKVDWKALFKPSTAVLYFQFPKDYKEPAKASTFVPSTVDDTDLGENNRRRLVRGVADVLAALASDEGDTKVKAWVRSLDQVIARFVARATADLARSGRSMFKDYCHNSVAQLAAADGGGFDAFSNSDGTAFFFRREVKVGRDLWAVKMQNSRNPKWTPPSFAIDHPMHAWRDYLNCDVPSFYHRLGDAILRNSRGDAIDVADVVAWQNDARNITGAPALSDDCGRGAGPNNATSRIITYLPERPVDMVLRQLSANRDAYNADATTFVRSVLWRLQIQDSTISRYVSEERGDQ